MTVENGDKLISVVIPLYNKQDYISDTIQSVLRQTYQNFEIIVIDDGSTDKSSAIVESINDNRIRLFKQPNAGVSTARNTGIAKSRGEWIAFIDADDEWESEYLKHQIELIETFPQCSVYATNYTFKFIDGVTSNTVVNKLEFEEECGELINYFAVASFSNCHLWTSAVVVRKDALQKVGGFPERITSGEDLLTWAKLVCIYRVAYSRRPLAIYRIPNASTKKNKIGRPHDRIDTVGKELRILYDNNKDIPGLKSYLSFWHKMRASVSMRLNNSADAIKECLISLKYNPLNIKAIAILILCLMPKCIRHKIIE